MSLPAELVGKKPPLNKNDVQPPPGIGRIFWRWRIWFDSTFGLSMLDTWEVSILYLVFGLITALFWFSVFTYFPSHSSYLARRFSYYVYGDETVDALAAFKNWIGDMVRDGFKAVTNGGGGGKEL